MILKFSKGDTKTHVYQVRPQDTARFEAGEVHSVCSTFVLAREMEWAGRLFVLEMKEAEEEGIGTRIELKHRSPAAVGATLRFEAEYQGLEKEEILVQIRVFAENRLVAEGLTGQRIMPKEKIKELFSKI
jgi:fluoroacetyl-CoA thioesterase